MTTRIEVSYDKQSAVFTHKDGSTTALVAKYGEPDCSSCYLLSRSFCYDARGKIQCEKPYREERIVWIEKDEWCTTQRTCVHVISSGLLSKSLRPRETATKFSKPNSQNCAKIANASHVRIAEKLMDWRKKHTATRVFTQILGEETTTTQWKRWSDAPQIPTSQIKQCDVSSVG